MNFLKRLPPRLVLWLIMLPVVIYLLFLVFQERSAG